MASDHSYGGYERRRFVDEIHQRFVCSICLKVFKDPVQCPNEHYFCHTCIERYLLASKRCPQCRCLLTRETLRISRFVREMLNDFDIRCVNVNRGCPDVIKLHNLKFHEENCGYSPTLCRNEGCNEIVKRKEIEEHEKNRCEFRIIECGQCKKTIVFSFKRSHPCFMRHEIDELTKRLEMFQMSQDDRVKHVEEQVKLSRNEMMFLTTETSERCNFLTGKTKIFVCGGYDGTTHLNSVESFNWYLDCWEEEAKMKKKRFAGAAFVHDRQIFVSGGWNGRKCLRDIESLNVDESTSWETTDVTLPIQCYGHSVVYCNDYIIMTGGSRSHNPFLASNAIYSIQLNPPYTRNLMTHMPEPRFYHSSLVIDDKVLVFGGGTSDQGKNSKNTVHSYSLSDKECKTLAPLPYAVSAMGIVSYKGNAILIGGLNDNDERLDKVLMYNVKTGQTKMLPSLNHKRCGCSAVILGNIIVVVGGHDGESFLDSVECLDMSANVWRELSSMSMKREYPVAVVSPIY
ncbi:influenza virus NS1A-binding protein homolog B-like [Xenia sp. Carnegie-2017]|uniref:influenza virus NS1A-binding protein homolog B-like n=1 Tax=Xenia sp. Carnegie-2017 TaxID=2897299 RepID=UPI001F0362CE|nr:influenza virus NS1A-binding protein homolog B-like [Xenia sp. Carnegie-2017]